jgi:putative SOS response-associated peptidase YedK
MGSLAEADAQEANEPCTIVTTSRNAFAAQFHDRMPVVLKMNDIDDCLAAKPDDAAPLMRSAQDDVLQDRRLKKAVNNVKNSFADY